MSDESFSTFLSLMFFKGIFLYDSLLLDDLYLNGQLALLEKGISIKSWGQDQSGETHRKSEK